MSWKTNREINEAMKEETIIREYEFMKKYGVDIASVPPGMAIMLEAACNSAYNRGWADCRAKVDGKDTNVPSKWIPCSERLPEEEGVYFLTIATTSNIRWVRTGILYSDGRFNSENVLAWMPLPEPYKEDVDND